MCFIALPNSAPGLMCEFFHADLVNLQFQSTPPLKKPPEGGFSKPGPIVGWSGPAILVAD